jgi:hypothetical protein
MSSFHGTANKDTFVGSAGDDSFTFNIANLSAEDTIVGGGGSDILFIEPVIDPLIINQAQLAGMRGISSIVLPYFITAEMSLNDSILAANPDLVIYGQSNVTIDASSTTLGTHIWVGNSIRFSGGGRATVIGGSGNDRFDIIVEDFEKGRLAERQWRDRPTAHQVLHARTERQSQLCQRHGTGLAGYWRFGDRHRLGARQ